MYYLSILAIFKNESYILEEWLTHYINEGVEHFYLIDNGSTDNYQETISKFQDKITLFIDPKRFSQIEHYNNYVLPHKDNSVWIMVVDLDEFVYARTFNKITDYLINLDDNIGSVSIPWKMFGSSGFIEQPVSVIQNFTSICTKRLLLNNSNMCVKSIIRTKYLIQFDIHISSIINCDSILSDGSIYNNRPILYDANENIYNSDLNLNHYAIQSLNWFRDIKITRGAADSLTHNTIRTLKYFKNYDTNDDYFTYYII
jgi:hypothetical protein